MKENPPVDKCMENMTVTMMETKRNDQILQEKTSGDN